MTGNHLNKIKIRIRDKIFKKLVKVLEFKNSLLLISKKIA